MPPHSSHQRATLGGSDGNGQQIPESPAPTRLAGGTVIPRAGISGIISFPTVMYGRPGLQTVPLNRATANLGFNCPASGELLPPPLIAAQPPLSGFHINIVISSGSLRARVHYEGY